MPKLRATPQELREKAMMAAIGRGRGLNGLWKQKEVAEFVGLTEYGYSRAKKDNFMGLSLKQFSEMARKLAFTDRELCEIVGIPYQGGTA